MDQNNKLLQATPIYFGSPSKPILGLYHAPWREMEQEYGVVICHPIVQEYIRSHRAMYQVAAQLARAGFPCLRFDYYGTGDSNGDDLDGNPTQWQTDLRAAIQELKRRSHVESVYLVGLRFGATLAAMVSAGRIDIQGVVLWEPVINGNDYLQELQEWHQEKLWYFLGDRPAQSQPVKDPVELVGFAISATMLHDLNQIDLTSIQRRPAGRILLIESDATESGEKLKEQFQLLGAQVDREIIDSFKIWTENPDKGLVPQPVIQAVVSWMVRMSA